MKSPHGDSQGNPMNDAPPPQDSAVSEFERRVIQVFEGLKSGPFGTNILAGETFGRVVELLPFTRDLLTSPELVQLLANWREANIAGFTKVFRVTAGGTQSWSRSQLIERRDRICFLLRQPGGPLFGHVGLSSFDFAARTCELDNIVRGENTAPKGIMQSALVRLLDWTYKNLRPAEIRLQTLNDNSRALALYHRIGFIPFALYPLTRVDGHDFIEWTPAQPTDRFDRFMIAMRHQRP
jgi:RimJ/RimL family protein N-acetyltransferase